MPDCHLVGLPGPLFGATATGLASPRTAAAQAIGLMRGLIRLGLPVAVLPPLVRPDATILKSVGFFGDDATVAAAAALRSPDLHRIACADAAARTAAIATCIPAAEAIDGRIHLVVANQAGADGQIDAPLRTAQLRALFPDRARVMVHDPLPPIAALADFGGINHHRLAAGERACHLLVHANGGRRSGQARGASEAVARLCGIVDACHVHLSPAAVDAGAEGADAVMTGVRDRLLIHELALADQAAVLEELRGRVPGFRVAVVRESELALAEALRSRLFGSCLLRTPAGHVLVRPASARQGPARQVVDRLLAEGFIGGVEHLDLDAVLPGNLGPSSLRLRIPLAADGIAAIHPGIRCDPRRLDTLDAWARSTCRERLSGDDLGDPRVLEEAREALDLLARLLGLPAGFYPPRGGREASSASAVR